ncbi:putative ATPase [Cylindrospermum stagnale PCC 7417]|uniref:Putative ATPase n=1 Tax=Cylindrospermum stagnale PCC 7417 TaxID=56107 RepID=K9WU29_9NOST|nr:AAA family ATPase [Cylindrospermum stagnale]AFZ23890.1 putative ATPase [Cylindrospermum stagnale PCC 7417]
MEGKRFIHKIKLQNFLSYGSEGEEIELQPLNVLIGANTSGKSNLIESLGILRATPTDLPAPFRQGGGVSEFLWKGGNEIPVAEIQVTVDYSEVTQSLDYKLKFTSTGQGLDLIDEVIENKSSNSSDNIVADFYTNNRGSPTLSKGIKYIQPISLTPNQSILSQIKNTVQYPAISYLGNRFANIALYREWGLAQISEIKKPQKSDLPGHPLLENGRNLGLFLNNLQYKIGNKVVIENLKKLDDAAEELRIEIHGATVQIFICEEGLSQPISANRLSDGTLRYLFLMALLLDPNPPPLICLEAPEIGLHPDILPTIAEMLIKASQRTQLIVTTYSDTLLSALSEYPELVLICERDEKGSHLHRLEPDKLKDWLEKYTLGDLWRMGEIGGNRW